jgi:hypothetical protein
MHFVQPGQISQVNLISFIIQNLIGSFGFSEIPHIVSNSVTIYSRYMTPMGDVTIRLTVPLLFVAMAILICNMQKP